MSKECQILRRSQNLKYAGFKNLSPEQFWGTPNHTDIVEF